VLSWEHPIPDAPWWNIYLFTYKYGQFIDGLPIKNDDFPWQTVSHNLHHLPKK